MYRLGIDIGGTNTCVGIVDEDFNIISKITIKTNTLQNKTEFSNAIITLCQKILTKNSLNLENISFIGIGIPGIVNVASGIVEFSANLHVSNWCIKKDLEQKLNKKVLIENDANAAAIGEYLAHPNKNVSCAVMITLGTGIGSGIIIDRKIYHGSNYSDAELGHMVIVQNGRLCSCKRRGCWESYASATGLINITKEMLKNYPDNTVIQDIISGDVTKITAKTAFIAAKLHDNLGAKIIEKYVRYLACGLTNVVNIFQPQVIYIGGGLSNEPGNWLDKARKIVKNECYNKNSAAQTKIEIAPFKNDAGIIGAAFLDYMQNT